MWAARDKNGSIVVFNLKPERWRDEQVCSEEDMEDGKILSKNFPIEKYLGRELKWEDEPVEFKVTN